jgi:hypothetical protein
MLSACAPREGSFVLTDPSAWRATAVDPFPEHAEGRVACADHWLEDGIVEVDTGDCPYLLIAQPAQVEGLVGDTLSGGVLWDTLYADTAAEAHIALSVDGVPLWEDHVPVPSSAGWARLELTLSEPILPGAQIAWHLHNHGLNRWNLLNLTLTAP